MTTHAALAFLDAFSDPGVIQWKLWLVLAGFCFYVAGPAAYVMLRFDPMGAHPEAAATGITLWVIGALLIAVVCVF
jgi:hypothetical protein